MYRFIANIIDFEKIEERKDGDFRVNKLRLRLRIKDIFPNCPKPPRYIKGRTVCVTREYPHPFEPKPGDQIILSPEEVSKIIPRIYGDVIRDGYKELLLKNDCMSVTILPHLGARIGSLVYKGREYLGSRIAYEEKKWVDIGGIYDSIDGNFPGSIACSEFEPKKQTTKKLSSRFDIPTGNRCKVCYDKKGLEIVKEFSLDAFYPIILESTTVKAKQKRDIIYSKYLPIKRVENETVLYVPTEEKLDYRYHQKDSVMSFWRPAEFYGLKLGSFLVVDEGASFLFATHKQKTEYLKLRYSQNRFLVQLYWEKKELKKGESFTYGCVYAVGDEYRIEPSSIVIKAEIGSKNFFLVRADDKFSGSIEWNEKEIKLSSIEIKDIGRLWLN